MQLQDQAALPFSHFRVLDLFRNPLAAPLDKVIGERLPWLSQMNLEFTSVPAIDCELLETAERLRMGRLLDSPACAGLDGMPDTWHRDGLSIAANRLRSWEA